MSRLTAVRCAWDSDAAVWQVSEGDVPGLATEAASLEALRQRRPGLIRDLPAVDLIACAHDRGRGGAA